MGAATFSMEVEEATVVIAVTGELDLSNAAELGRQIAGAPRRSGMVVDLSELRYVDSSGLSELLRAHLALEESGSRLAIVAPSEILRRTFHIRGVDNMLTIAETRDAAVAARGR
jgi:anti-sigma B factor antagonist